MLQKMLSISYGKSKVPKRKRMKRWERKRLKRWKRKRMGASSEDKDNKSKLFQFGKGKIILT